MTNNRAKKRSTSNTSTSGGTRAERPSGSALSGRRDSAFRLSATLSLLGSVVVLGAGCGARSTLDLGAWYEDDSTTTDPDSPTDDPDRPDLPDGPDGPDGPDRPDQPPLPGTGGATMMPDPDCVPNCDGQACGADDGCGNPCATGSCEEGSLCEAGECVCDASTCQGCCSGGTCRDGTESNACGSDGLSCQNCGLGECVFGSCDLGVESSLLLFGGSRSWGGYVDDTWSFDGEEWTLHKVPGPSARAAGAMATLEDKSVLFGGIYSQGGHGDTWEWDGSEWTLKDVPGPSGRWSHRMATLGDKVILFGGYNTDYLGDTWEWDGTKWTELMVPGPQARTFHAMATVGDKIVLYGGQREGGPLDTTWEWDGEAWTEFETEVNPGHRTSHGMAGTASEAVLYGGGTSSQYTTDTWVWKDHTWTHVAEEGPPKRASSAMAYLEGKIILFGGLVSQGGGKYHYYSDTWQWDGAIWTQLNVSGPTGVAGPFLTAR